MKEAAGEANLTVIAILLIGVIAAIATPLIKTIMNNTGASSCCQSLGYIWKDGECFKSDMTTKVVVSSENGTCSVSTGS